MKRSLVVMAALFAGLTSMAQDFGSFTGGFESNTQWYQNDDGIDFEAPRDRLRSNNYFRLDYNLGAFTAGMQYEAYAPTSLLGYSPNLDGNAIATYYFNYKRQGLDITAGYFYDQFGSGLVFRSWESRQLGINTAMRGVRVAYDFKDYLRVTGFTGNQRNGFELSEGTVSGVNAEFDLGTAAGWESNSLTFGASYINRYNESTNPDPDFPSVVGAYSARVDYNSADGFFGGYEFAYKEGDAVTSFNQLLTERYFDGTAHLLNLGYSRKGLGINATLRRIENWNFYSDREARGNQFNEQLINYIPALTKQQDYLLTNIYVYAAQPSLNLSENRFGEIGGQMDLFYTFKKGSALGGKYGTKLAANFASWYGLDGTADLAGVNYETDFLGTGDLAFQEVSLEVRKRFNKNFNGIFTAVRSEYNPQIIEGSPSDNYKSLIFVADLTQRLGNGRSIRWEGQHLSSKQDRGNWAASVLEYNVNTRLAVFASDVWNYDETDIHYYTFGTAYASGNTRVAFQWGRQRGGLVCVGGVCRFVPENNGFTLNLSALF